MTSSDLQTDLWNRIQAGDKSALKALFELHYHGICQTIHRYVADHALVEDLAQEVFVRFWEKRQQITIAVSVQAYLRRMAVNEALGWLRRNKRWEEEEFHPEMSAALDYSAEEQFMQGEMERSIASAIDALPPKCRMVFQLSRFEELTYQEIADQMGISIKTVENQMGKALRLLRERLKAYLEVEN